MLQSRHFGVEPPQVVADLMNHCFEDYIVQIGLTLPLISQMYRSDSIDIFESRIFSVGDEDVALAIIGRRGETCRLGAMAIAKNHRGKGIGRQVMAQLVREAKERGDKRMILEVIRANTAALRLYESVGFRIVDDLYGYVGTVEAAAGPVEETTAREMAYAVAASPEREAWQADVATVLQLTAPLRFVRLGSAFLAYAAPEDRDVLLARAFTCDNTHEAAALLKAVAARHPNRTWHFPPFYRSKKLAEVCHSLGVQKGEISQYQMELTLGEG